MERRKKGEGMGLMERRKKKREPRARRHVAGGKSRITWKKGKRGEKSKTIRRISPFSPSSLYPIHAGHARTLCPGLFVCLFVCFC